MTTLGIWDVETTGLDAKKDEIIELGFAVCDWETKKPICLQSDNIQFDGELKEDTIRLTGIKQFMVAAPYAVPIKNAMHRAMRLAPVCDYYVAHNAEFDFGFLREAAKKSGLQIPVRPIIDTRYDLPYRDEQKSFQLNYLLSDYGLFNPFAHRAVFDCMSTFKLMCEFKWEDIIELNQSDMITIEAMEPGSNGRRSLQFANKDLARNKGFRWEPDGKMWLLDIKRCKFDRIKESLPFDTRIESLEIPF